jgi:hypothetical protein
MGLVLGLDRSGVSIFTGAGIHHRCLTIDANLVRENQGDTQISEAERVMRMLHVANEVVSIVDLFKVRHVGLMAVAERRTQRLGEVVGVVKSQLWMKYKLATRSVTLVSARKHVIGYGGVQVDREQVIGAVRSGLGVMAENDGEADATIVARYTFDTVVAEEKEL